MRHIGKSIDRDLGEFTGFILLFRGKDGIVFLHRLNKPLTFVLFCGKLKII